MKKILGLMAALTFTGAFAQKQFKYTGNPLVRHLYTADPTARVFDGKLYVYTSHDADQANYFDMTDWRVLSTTDMVNWTDHGDFFGLKQVPWAEKWAWAPDCVERGGKYYFYYPTDRAKIGVAVSDHPIKGFKDSGKPLVDNANAIDSIGPEPIDPSVIVHKGQAYMFFGCREPRVVKLKKNMVETDGPVKRVKFIGNENDPEHFGGYYGEGPFVFKRKGTYYMVYANGWGKQSTLVYATTKSPEEPFVYQGEIMAPVSSFTSHGSMVEYKGQWYIFYHTKDLSNNDYRRSVCFDKISFDKKGRIERIIPTQTLK